MHDDFLHQGSVLNPIKGVLVPIGRKSCLCVCHSHFFQANTHYCVVLLHTSLGICLPGLEKSLTCSLESALIDLTIALDDVNLRSSAVGERSDLPRALIPAHRSGARVEGLDKSEGLAGGHGKATGKCLVIECFASLLKNG